MSRLALAAGCAFLAGMAAAQAQSAPQPNPTATVPEQIHRAPTDAQIADPAATRAMLRSDHDRLFGAADLNRDGRVSRQEAAAAAQRWIDRSDRNADGRLSIEEFQAEGGQSATAAQDHRGAEATEAFRRLDENGDGGLGQGELTAVFERMLQQGDTDNDQTLSRAEIGALERRDRAELPAPAAGSTMQR